MLKNVKTLAVITAALVGSFANVAQAADDIALPKDYRLVWADEFNGKGLPDPSRWAYDTEANKTGWYNHEKQYYSGPRLENAEVKGGVLRITARKEARQDQPDWGGQDYSSTRLITRGKADWLYGFFEIRAKLPCGKGTWPAIWFLGTGGKWPDDGELDLLEQIGHAPDHVFSTTHTKAGNGGQGVSGGRRLATACSQFHRYQMHWTENEVRFGIDGHTHFRYTRQDTGSPEGNARVWPFDKPQYLILNLAMGGDLGGAIDDAALPRTFEVDYVRVYQPSPK
ncbi:glycoside hydrolase family 16 protein [Roseateles paludis]|uniref:Glycoside hydrolase family 16 protein n=1 Tax=Roseateles paludis TaxID=3145238 RepID=A0ABV0FZU6_9BURK